MVNAYVDWETKGLDATKPILGTLRIEGAKKYKTFTKPERMWKYIIELGRKEKRRGKNLNVYMHNAQFDTAVYVDILDKNMEFFCNTPLIWHYKEKEETIITLLDTMSLYPKMSLEKVARLIGTKKIDYPVEKLERWKPTKKKIEELKEYCANDTKILDLAIKKIKSKLKEEGITIRRLYTINQLGRNYLFNKWLKLPKEYKEPYFWNEMRSQARRTIRRKEIHASYRGGRCEAWKTGKDFKKRIRLEAQLVELAEERLKWNKKK